MSNSLYLETLFDDIREYLYEEVLHLVPRSVEDEVSFDYYEDISLSTAE